MGPAAVRTWANLAKKSNTVLVLVQRGCCKTPCKLAERPVTGIPLRAGKVARLRHG